MNPTASRLYWVYQKNRHLVDALLLRRAPGFVYKAAPRPVEGEIPVFTFHLALPDWFEEQCRHLVDNGYRTLTTEEFNSRLSSSGSRARKTVFITFDDGLKHVWTVAYPLLKKHGLHATCYLIPGCIPESDMRVRPTLEDVWQGTATVDDVMGIHRDEPALATWEEIRIMHESGVIDFQSHTMNHALVPVSDRIIDFVHPRYDCHFYGNVRIPLYTRNGSDVLSRDPVLGMPVYYSMPRMQAQARYFDDEGLREHCTDTVNRHGGKEFFERKDWKAFLEKSVKEYRSKNRIHEHTETPGERDATLLDELGTAREVIEERLPGKPVTQLCYPWYDASEHAIKASRKAGYTVNLFGQRNNRICNRPGDDPMEVVRLEEIFLQRLPGKNRKSVLQTLGKMYDLRSLPALLFPDGRQPIG